jgi:Fe-S cluster assembly scaffold protein SufB
MDKMMDMIMKKALEAKEKQAVFGPDIDLNKYSMESEKHESISHLTELPEEYQKAVLQVGIDANEYQRSGSYFQIDHSVIFSRSIQNGLEVMSTTEALKKYDWLREYWWKAVPVDMDKYTAQAELKQTHGYFLRALPGVKAIFPVQACLFIGKNGLAQNVHNIIIAEENSELHLITGCMAAPHIRSGLHIGISEFFVKRNAKITFTMIHAWKKEMDVRPRTGAIIEENGVFINNYICMRPVKSLQMYPTAYCIGKNSRARYHTILYASENSIMDVGSRVILRAENSRAEVIARAIAKDNGNIIARGHLKGEVPGVKAHLECRGLLLSKNASIHAIPELEGKTEGVDLSHEAAVGKIAEEEIQYLMARGLSSEEATAIIVRGFLNIDIQGLPEQLIKEMKRIIDISTKQIM